MLAIRNVTEEDWTYQESWRTGRDGFALQGECGINGVVASGRRGRTYSRRRRRERGETS